MKLVRESLVSFQRGGDPMTSIGIGIEAAIRRIKDEIGWKIEDDRWKGPGMLIFNGWQLSEIYKTGGDLERMAVKKILEEFLSGKKKWRESFIPAREITSLLSKTGLLWDPQYMWPTPNNVDSVRNIDPQKFDQFISKYWKPNQIYGAGVKYENANLMKKGILAGATNLNIGGTQTFVTAAEQGDYELMKLLLEKTPNSPAGETKDERRYSTGDKDTSNAPIRIAARNGNIEIVKLLMKDPRVDPSAANNFALSWAFYGGHKDVAILLLTDKRVRDKVDLIPKTRQKELRSAGLIESENFRRGLDPKKAMDIGTSYEGLTVYRCEGCGAITDQHGYPFREDDPEYDRAIDLIDKFGDKTTRPTFCDECHYEEEMRAQEYEERERQEEEARWQWEQDNYDQNRY